MMSCTIRSGKRHWILDIVDRCTVRVQPAGPARKRHVFLTLSIAADDKNAVQQIELVLPELAANQLGEALISGSVGVMREFDL
jgi:hypothetical protein